MRKGILGCCVVPEAKTTDSKVQPSCCRGRVFRVGVLAALHEDDTGILPSLPLGICQAEAFLDYRVFQAVLDPHGPYVALLAVKQVPIEIISVATKHPRVLVLRVSLEDLVQGGDPLEVSAL